MLTGRFKNEQTGWPEDQPQVLYGFPYDIEIERHTM